MNVSADERLTRWSRRGFYLCVPTCVPVIAWCDGLLLSVAAVVLTVVLLCCVWVELEYDRLASRR